MKTVPSIEIGSVSPPRGVIDEFSCESAESSPSTGWRSPVRPSQTQSNYLSPSKTPVQTSVATESNQPISVRNHPIPPPSHPKQYRAIGLIQGQYTPSENILTRGILRTANNLEIPAVLLGRTLSLIKNHLDLSQPHLWVVYPRSRQAGDGLHVQIAGVWEPAVLSPETPNPDTSTGKSREDVLPIQDGVFSVRGEVVFYDASAQKAVVRIQQAPRRESESEKYFKLSLNGLLPSDRPLRHFWDIRASLQGAVLIITAAQDMGLLPPKKRSKGKARSRRGSQPQSRTTRQ